MLLLLLTGKHPRRLVLADFAGAAVLTISASLLALVNTAGLTTEDLSTASGWIYVAVGVLLLGLAVWVAAKGPRP
jgi:hypothetical protein